MKKILIINPPHKSIGSRLANEHLPPLGLLSIAGPLIDSGYDVKLLDADYHNFPIEGIVSQVVDELPDFVLMGHSGSTSAQPVINRLAWLIKQEINCKIIVGGVFPTYHWKEILEQNESIDYIVCGEAEQVCLSLITTLTSEPLNIFEVKGIAYRVEDKILKNPNAPLIKDLDQYRVAWELMKDYDYTYWGKKKAVVLQFSRGCPYPCAYCGQNLFWQKFRYRNPQKLADEIEMLHKDFGIEVINFADENPSSNPKVWKEFLNALIAKKLNLILVGSIRADNIVRDKDFLHLYKKAGFERFLLGIENYDEQVLEKIKKTGSISKDKEAIQLLRKHGILSMATYVVGFEDEKPQNFYYNLRQLLDYDPDQIQLLYLTPHQWTPYFSEVEEREIIIEDQSYWDYKHQVLKTQFLKPWQMILLVKLVELLLQIRPKAIFRTYFQKDKSLRKAMQWYVNIGRRVWFWELYQFFFVTPRVKKTIQMKNFWKPFNIQNPNSKIILNKPSPQELIEV